MTTPFRSSKGTARLLPAFMGAALLVSMAGCSTCTKCSKSPAASSDSKVELLFVQTAEQLEVDSAKNTFRLGHVNQQTLYFSDRPYRIAGHLKMAEYLEEWTSKAGEDSFAKDPPNAVLSVYEPGQPDTAVAVVTISNPVVDGVDLVYDYKVVSGTMPEDSGATCLFIDRIGVGGGVGVGYHGVGVGRRGPGVR